jgi:hypothetical protein
MNQTELIVNRIAQSKLPLDDGLEWFDNASSDEQREILRKFDYIFYQAHPTVDEVERGIATSGLKPTYTPCVIIASNHFNEARHKILAMPDHELPKAFRLWLSIFSIADGRRRATACKDGCDHEWHNLD